MIVAISLASLAIAQDQSVEPESEGAQAEAMTAERLSALILSVDEDAQLNDTVWFFHVAELETAVIYDIAADRMRIIMPIGSTDGISSDELIRVMRGPTTTLLWMRDTRLRMNRCGVSIFIHSANCRTTSFSQRSAKP